APAVFSPLSLHDALPILVARLVTIQVIDILEIIQIKEHQRGILATLCTVRHGLLQAVEQQAPIGQTGQGVVKRQVANLLLCLLRSEEHTSELQSRENLVC